MSQFKCANCQGESFSVQNILIDGSSIPVIVCNQCQNIIGCSDIISINALSTKIQQIEARINEMRPKSEEEINRDILNIARGTK